MNPLGFPFEFPGRSSCSGPSRVNFPFYGTQKRQRKSCSTLMSGCRELGQSKSEESMFAVDVFGLPTDQ